MKRNFFFLLGLPSYLAFFSTVGYSTICKSLAYADEALNTLQHDVILAKQKHEAISNKIDTASSLLDAEKSRTLQEEAQALMQQLTEKGYSKSQTQTQTEKTSVKGDKSNWLSRLKDKFVKQNSA